MKQDHTITAIVSVLLAVTGLAVISALLSRQSQTGSVLQAGGGAISRALCVALSPIMGSGSCGGSLIPSVNSTITYPGFGGSGCQLNCSPNQTPNYVLCKCEDVQSTITY